MAAAAFTETLIFKGASNGKGIQLRVTVSDVIGEYGVFSDGQGVIQLPSDQNYALADVIVVTGGTDTSNQEVYANGLSTGLYLDNKSNLNTTNDRQFQQSPVIFRAGAALRFKQLA